MMRILFEYVLPLIAPFVVYFGWAWISAKRAAAVGKQAPDWREGPWFWLTVVGIVLLIAAMIWTALMGGVAPGEYHPPVYKDGQIVPGHVTPANPGR